MFEFVNVKWLRCDQLICAMHFVEAKTEENKKEEDKEAKTKCSRTFRAPITFFTIDLSLIYLRI